MRRSHSKRLVRVMMYFITISLVHVVQPSPFNFRSTTSHNSNISVPFFFKLSICLTVVFPASRSIHNHAFTAVTMETARQGESQHQRTPRTPTNRIQPPSHPTPA